MRVVIGIDGRPIVAGAPPRKPGPRHLERFLPDRARREFPWWWIREYEFRADAWHVLHEYPERPGMGGRVHHGRPPGIIVSKPAPGIRQVELSLRDGRGMHAVDAEGYAR